MADFKEQVLRVWDEWEETTGQDANNPDDFVAWALAHKKLAPQPQELRRMLRKQVTKVLRQVQRTDENGITYRAKQCVIISEEGVQIPLWFDTDRGGTPNLRQKALHQRREAIANDVYRAVCDKDHMNSVFPDDPQLNFFPDFTDDCAERRAAEALKQETDDEEDDAA
jgi:hypothetical protein